MTVSSLILGNSPTDHHLKKIIQGKLFIMFCTLSIEKERDIIMRIIKIQLLVLLCFISIICTSCSSNIDLPPTPLSSPGTTISPTTLPSPTLPSMPSLSADEILPTNHDNVNSTVQDSLISKYYGSIDVQDGLMTYKIMTRKTDDNKYVIELLIFDYGREEEEDGLIQSITYDVDSSFMPETVRQGLEIADVNRDGSDDIILSLGIWGKFTYSVCYVYDLESKNYTKLRGFDEISSPEFSDGFEFLFGKWQDNAREYGIDKYVVNGSEVNLIAKLRIEYATSQGTRYTEQKVIDGELVDIKKNVSYEEINVEEWGKHVPQP